MKKIKAPKSFDTVLKATAPDWLQIPTGVFIVMTELEDEMKAEVSIFLDPDRKEELKKDSCALAMLNFKEKRVLGSKDIETAETVYGEFNEPRSSRRMRIDLKEKSLPTSKQPTGTAWAYKDGSGNRYQVHPSGLTVPENTGRMRGRSFFGLPYGSTIVMENGEQWVLCDKDFTTKTFTVYDAFKPDSYLTNVCPMLGTSRKHNKYTHLTVKRGDDWFRRGETPSIVFPTYKQAARALEVGSHIKQGDVVEWCIKNNIGDPPEIDVMGWDYFDSLCEEG